MPISPRRPKNSASDTKTRRSSVSGAYNFKGLVPREGSAVTAGTITNPSATAAELLAAQPPFASKSPSNNPSISSAPSVTKPFQTSSTKVSFVPNSLVNSQVGGPNSQSQAGSQAGGVFQPNASQPGANPPTASNIGRLLQGKASQVVDRQTVGQIAGAKQSDATSQEPYGSQAQAQSPASGQQAPEVKVESPNKFAIFDVTGGLGSKLELLFSLIATGIFFALWTFMLTANCYQDPYWTYALKVISLASGFVGLFFVFHSCFERRMAIGRGVAGCVFFFILAIISFVNLVGGFFAMSCICDCPAATTNAFQANRPKDLIIFILELVGGVALLMVLLVSSISHN